MGLDILFELGFETWLVYIFRWNFTVLSIGGFDITILAIMLFIVAAVLLRRTIKKHYKTIED